MEYLFYALVAGIMGIVIYLTFKAVGSGLDARSQLKRSGTLEKNKENPYTFKSIEADENDKILEKLKDKKLSSADLKKIYEDLQKKK
tara:strand:+ start:997 stop:1257 length:261 start_codon:yes stop_codon:yes gene_type:complete